MPSERDATQFLATAIYEERIVSANATFTSATDVNRSLSMTEKTPELRGVSKKLKIEQPSQKKSNFQHSKMVFAEKEEAGSMVSRGHGSTSLKQSDNASSKRVNSGRLTRDAVQSRPLIHFSMLQQSNQSIRESTEREHPGSTNQSPSVRQNLIEEVQKVGSLKPSSRKNNTDRQTSTKTRRVRAQTTRSKHDNKHDQTFEAKAAPK